MRASSFASTLLFFTLAGAATAQEPASPAAETVPVVVAVDTSRSLSAGELAGVVERLRAALGRLPPSTPSGLVAFDDAPRWLRPLGTRPAEVAAALGELEPGGDFTLLNDALFVAVRALEEGGVVLLATDGRDENSATTVEDIARRCEAQGVRILSVGSGRSIAERSLRRLALLSGGSYLGEATAVEAAEIAAAVTESRSEVAAERSAAGRSAAARPTPEGQGPPPIARPADPPGPSPASAAEGDAATPGGTASGGFVSWLLPLLLAAALLLLLAALVLLLARRPRPAAAEELGDTDELELYDRLKDREAAPPVEAEEVSVDTAVVHRLSLEERLDKTRVLAQESVLWVREPGEAPRSFVLSPAKAFAVGRDPELNTLAVPDPALSGRHFKIVGEDGRYSVLDLHSTNGTFVNGRKVLARHLDPGDVIHAGQVEFEIKRHGESSL